MCVMLRHVRERVSATRERECQRCEREGVGDVSRRCEREGVGDARERVSAMRERGCQ
jgi:hypothetical protein